MLKKLDDRSLVLVHLGTEPGSKAYRLYNPDTRRIVVNRDVVFDEEKSWNWNKTTGTTRDPGMFQMKWGEVIDAGEGPVAKVKKIKRSNESVSNEELSSCWDGTGPKTHGLTGPYKGYRLVHMAISLPSHSTPNSPS
ncbi:hypothetical protein Bca4012_079572 [Brassica carinata]